MFGHLRQKQMLLVLDNFEHLVEAAGLLVELLNAAPGVRLLVTSRERLNLREEWVWEVGGLAYPEERLDMRLERLWQSSISSSPNLQRGRSLLPPGPTGSN